MASFTTAGATRTACYVVFHTLFELMRVVCEAEGARCVARALPRRRALHPVGGIGGGGAAAADRAPVRRRQAGLHLPLPQFKVFAAILVALFAGYARAAAAACRRRPPADDDAEEEGPAERAGGACRVPER